MTSPVIGTPWKKLNAPVSEEALEGVDKYWRVANYLSIGQIYLRSNPLMKEPFTREDVKHRLVGHWGTTPGLNFLIGHINRFIADHGQNTVIIMGPGHGGPAGTSQSYLDGTYTETYPNITKDEAGLQKFFRQFSYPGGIPSHFAPETPGSIHEGGELGYALSHAYGAIMDNPSLFVPCIVGDGEAETGPLATGWQSNKLVNPRTDGIVLPILHLNGYKIANPTILSRISDEELHEFFHGMGYEPYEFVAGFDDEDHMSIHRRFAELFESVWDEICDIKAAANTDNMHRPFYPMIIFRTPKGWTCPKYIDGKKTEGSWRAHQVPLASARDTEAHFEVLKGWLESYEPDGLFDEKGGIRPEVTEFMPEGELRLGANPNTNGGKLLEDLKLPETSKYEIDVKNGGHGFGATEATRVLGEYTAELINSGLASYGVSLNGDNTPLFQFGERPAVDPADRSGMNLTITFSPDDIDCLNYDTGTGLYALSNGDGSPVQDADNGQQAAFTNVFVLYASSGIKDDGYTRQYDMTGGTGLYLQGGAWEQIHWTKEDATGPFVITNEAGETLVVSQGKSFIAIWGGYYGQSLSLTAADGSAQTLPDKPALLESGIPDDAAAAAEAEYKAAQEATNAQAELARAQAELPDAQTALEEAQAALDADPENQDLITARDNAQANVDALNAILAAAEQQDGQAE